MKPAFPPAIPQLPNQSVHPIETVRNPANQTSDSKELHDIPSKFPGCHPLKIRAGDDEQQNLFGNPVAKNGGDNNVRVNDHSHWLER